LKCLLERAQRWSCWLLSLSFQVFSP
jgi:hypothetical protein